MHLVKLQTLYWTCGAAIQAATYCENNNRNSVTSTVCAIAGAILLGTLAYNCGIGASKLAQLGVRVVGDRLGATVIPYLAGVATVVLQYTFVALAIKVFNMDSVKNFWFPEIPGYRGR